MHRALIALALAGCNGDTEANVEAPEPANFTCETSSRGVDQPLRRLSRTQHRLAVTDLVHDLLPTHEQSVLQQISIDLDALVPDQPQGPAKHFGRLSALDRAVTQSHIDRSYDLGTRLATALTAQDRWLDLADGCPPSETACLRDFVYKAGRLALRRPMTESDVERYLVPAGVEPHDPADWADVITLLTLSPEHLYHVEIVQDDGELLDAHALANRVAFHAWQRPPDAELRDLADSGAILDTSVYDAQVARLFGDERVRIAVRSFYSEWLGNTILEPLDSRLGTPLFDAFRGDFEPSADLRQAMLADVTDSAVYHTFSEDGTFDDLLTSEYSFARTPQLAQLYDTPVWDGQSEPATMTQPERAGLITRAAYLATGSANSRPIMKGVFLRTTILCDKIGLPPAGAGDAAPELQADMSTREFVHALTGGRECVGCHEHQINPLGFATENFDGLGRPRTEQPLYNANTGEVVGAASVDTRVTIRFAGADQDVADAHDLTALLVGSPKPRECITKHWFRYTTGRMEDEQRDGCALQAMDHALQQGRPLRVALQQIALSPAFKRYTPEAQ